MKPAPFALYALALAVVLAWPLSSAIGAARSRPAAADSDIQAAGCVPDLPGEAEAGDAPALPPGHPPIEGLLPPGHPPISSEVPRLPPGHPPVPSAHPPVAPALPFEAPALLTI